MQSNCTIVFEWKLTVLKLKLIVLPCLYWLLWALIDYVRMLVADKKLKWSLRVEGEFWKLLQICFEWERILILFFLLLVGNLCWIFFFFFSWIFQCLCRVTSSKESFIAILDFNCSIGRMPKLRPKSPLVSIVLDSSTISIAGEGQWEPLGTLNLHLVKFQSTIFAGWYLTIWACIWFVTQDIVLLTS